MRDFFRRWDRMAVFAALIAVMGVFFFPGGKTESLTDAPADKVKKAIGNRIEVEGIAVLDKEGYAIFAASFSALVDLPSGQQMPSGTKIHVTGTLHANDPQYGYAYRIVGGTSTEVRYASSKKPVQPEPATRISN